MKVPSFWRLLVVFLLELLELLILELLLVFLLELLEMELLEIQKLELQEMELLGIQKLTCNQRRQERSSGHLLWLLPKSNLHK